MEFVFCNHDIVILVILGLFLIGGAISGFANKFTKFISVVGALAITYFFSAAIANAICGIDVVKEWINGFEAGGLIILVGTYVVLFIVSLALLLAFITPISNFFLNGGPIRNTINHCLGAILGLFIGFLICSIYLLILNALGNIGDNNAIGEFINTSFGYSENKLTLSRMILDFALGSVGKIQESL